ncbi:hypothetical protein GA0116948_105132 [Chitinophaga costaii]|uniref:Uncharacterized protein n=1 Tax=Chitinophaga costaii TaxID=1335309 RepID=A0A1C4D8Y7_9BACT|nr:hypothetical protein DCM91_11425 [Chitinophaga costaii]SCC27688.1 hypothetical protein GA0116948_105132 [Chitinophaga costaii]
MINGLLRLVAGFFYCDISSVMFFPDIYQPSKNTFYFQHNAKNISINKRFTSKKKTPHIARPYG